MTPDEADRISGEILLEIAHLGEVWRQYALLFSEKQTRNLLSAHAPAFFGTVQRTFLSEVILGISRLTDPGRQGRNRERHNLSLEALLEDPRLEQGLPEVRSELEGLVQEVQDRADPIRTTRNQWVAHRDRLVALEAESLPLLPWDTFDEVIELLSRIHRAYGTKVAGTDYDHDGWQPGGAEALIEALEAAPDRLTRLREEEERDLARLREGRGVADPPEDARDPEEMAYHEAGHAVAAWTFGLPVLSISIRTSEHWSGRVEVDWVEDGEFEEAYLRAQALARLAGEIAWEIQTGESVDWERHSDVEGSDVNVYRTMADFLGWYEAEDGTVDYSPYMEKAMGEVRQLLRDRWNAVEALVRELREKLHLDGDVAVKLMEAAPGPEPIATVAEDLEVGQAKDDEIRRALAEGDEARLRELLKEAEEG